MNPALNSISKTELAGMRQVETEQEIAHLDESTQCLLKEIEVLAQRLIPVMREEAETKSESVPECMLCPLADQIRAGRKSVGHAIARIQGIVSRLEV